MSPRPDGFLQTLGACPGAPGGSAPSAISAAAILATVADAARAAALGGGTGTNPGADTAAELPRSSLPRVDLPPPLPEETGPARTLAWQADVTTAPAPSPSGSGGSDSSLTLAGSGPRATKVADEDAGVLAALCSSAARASPSSKPRFCRERGTQLSGRSEWKDARIASTVVRQLLLQITTNPIIYWRVTS